MPSDVNNNNPPSHGDRRKSSKPIMEKRRRARINASLTELKSLLLEVMKKEGARHNKMEKADILEMTVKHLRQLQRSQFAAAASVDPSVINKYTAGFNECANEVSRYLGGAEALDVEQRARLLNHLANFITNSRGNGPVNQNPVPSTTTTAYVRPIQTCAQSPHEGTSNTFTASAAPKLQTVSPKCENVSASANQDTAETQMQTQAQTRLLSGVQVIPTKMSNGEAAFIIPGNMLTSGQFGQIPGYVIPVYTGAPTSALHVQSNLQASAIISSPIPLNMQAYGATNQLLRIGLPTTSMTNDVPVLPATSTAPSNSRTETEPSANQEAAPAEQRVIPPDPAKEDVWRPW